MTLDTVLFSLAQGGSGGSGSGLAGMLPIVVIVGVFWFMIMRPQQRKQKEHRALLGAVKQGDKVVAAGGIVGTVRRVEDDTLHLQVADNVVIKVDKGTVAKKLADS
ncbi:MAG: preprotein translocase subunit YajC [Actinomycetota bacterium]